MKIPYPGEEQIQSSIQRICDRAPLGKRPTLLSFLRDMARNLGFRQIFFGTWDVMLISGLIFCVVGAVGAADLRSSVNQTQHATVFLFAFSPVVLFLLFSLSLWKEVEGPAYPIKMTCFYTAGHLMAFRVFCVTCLSFAAVGFYSLFLGAVLKLPSLPLLCSCIPCCRSRRCCRSVPISPSAGCWRPGYLGTAPPPDSFPGFIGSFCRRFPLLPGF